MTKTFRNFVGKAGLFLWKKIRSHRILHRAAVVVLHPFRPILLRSALNNEWNNYQNWIETVENKADIGSARARDLVNNLPYRPLLTIVMPCYETPPSFLREAIESLKAQHYPDWELCLVDDASPSNQIMGIVSEFGKSDNRIRSQRRTENGHIAVASNTALDMARGEWVVLMDHDDLLPANALLELVTEINKHPDAKIIYSDEDHVDAKRRRSNPYFKPDFDPDLLLGQNLVSHLGAYRRDLLDSIGGFRKGFEGSQDHDLILRASAACNPGEVRHIPAILYHWRQQTGRASFSEGALEKCIAASRRAVIDHLNHKNIKAAIGPAPLAPLFNRIQFPIPQPEPKVSIIIVPTSDAGSLHQCVNGLIQTTEYKNYEIFIAHGEGMSSARWDPIENSEVSKRIKFLSYPGLVHEAQLRNQAVREAFGDVILLLDPRIDIIEPKWLNEMVSHAIRPEVGAVGAKLLYRNNTVRHAGIVLGMGGPDDIAGHFGRGAQRNDPGPFGWLALLRSVSAVSGACLAVRRDLYESIGGLDEENLTIAFSDIDFCLRLRERGYRNVWTPFVELYHNDENVPDDGLCTAKVVHLQKDAAYMRRRWGENLKGDPYWNPHLSLNRASRDIAQQSRRENPWVGFMPQHDFNHQRR